MDINQKTKILTHLAKIADKDAKASDAIKREMESISNALSNSHDYDTLKSNLDLLDVIAYRVYEQAVSSINNFLKRLKTLELIHAEIPGYSSDVISSIHTHSKLTIKSLKVLEHIRYHQPDEIMDIFFEYSGSDDEKVSKQAKNGIEQLAGYHLDIYYGNGEDWPGLGWQPQEKIIEKLSGFDDGDLANNWEAVLTVADKLLSPTISGTTSTYNTVTWRSGAVQARDEIKSIRTKTLKILERLFDTVSDTKQKKAILNTMSSCTNTPHMGEYGDDVLKMITEDTIYFVNFMEKVAHKVNLELQQKIEHDAYWQLYRRGSLHNEIRESALRIRDSLYGDKEYQIFRILIGFESIFHEWDQTRSSSSDYENEKKYREEEAIKYADGINEENYSEWKERIKEYASIKSNDLATFPYFGKFLEQLGQSSPKIGMAILEESADDIENFITALLTGIAKTDTALAYSLIEKWIAQEIYTFNIARFFEFNPELNTEILLGVMRISIDKEDISTLNQIISSVIKHYSPETPELIKIFLIPCIESLTNLKNSSWIFAIWFKKEIRAAFQDMEDGDKTIILNNLIWLDDIDYHAEEVLMHMAEFSPELVVELFLQRISRERGDSVSRYNAIPFEFHKLSEPLSKMLDKVIDMVYEVYDKNYGLFMFNGAKLIKNIFITFPKEVQNKLINIAESEEEDDILFVIAILRNYDGDPVIYSTCKELVRIIKEDSSLINELFITLQSTGVVTGEFGFVEEYKKKIDLIKDWIDDEDQSVKDFALKYTEDLEKQIDIERKRAEEGIELRKHHYGSDDK